MNPITVLLADDHLIVREGLRSLLNVETDIQVICEAGNGREAVELTIALCPDVVVMDIAMPLLNGLEAIRQILRIRPATRIIILSAHSDHAYVEQVVALGATGYLIKQTAYHVLPEAIRDAHKGKTCFSPVIVKHLRQNQLNSGKADSPLTESDTPKLTSRELEVLQLVAEGKTNKETADELKISIKTVEKHRQNLMEKLAIHDTASLTRHAIAAGIIECSVQVTIL